MTFFVVTAGLLVLAYLTVAIRKWSQLGLYLITAAAVAQWDYPNLPGVSALGVNVYPEDAICAALAATVIWKPGRLLDRARPYGPGLVVIGALLTASLIGGLASFDIASVNDFRSFLYLILVAGWALNQPWDRSWFLTLRRWVEVTGTLLAVTAAVRALVYGLGAVDSFVVSSISGFNQTGRILTAGQALLLALAAIYLIRPSDDSGRVARALPWVFLAVVVIAQHRSVWIATAAALATIFLLPRKEVAGRLVVPVIIITWAALIAVLAGPADGLIEQLQEATAHRGTIDGRALSWQALVQQSFASGPWTVLFGSPFGAGYERLEAGKLIEYAPHNWYVTIYLRIGAIGLLAYVAIFASLLARLFRARDALPAANLVAIITYSLAYSITWMIGPFLAWSLVAAQPPGSSDRLQHVGHPGRGTATSRGRWCRTGTFAP